MKKTGILTICILLTLLQNCINKRSKEDLKLTIKIADNLYVEAYTVFGSGAFGGDLLSEYLTDHKNFSMYIGTFDESKEYFSYKYESGNIYVTKNLKDDKRNSKATETKVYSLSDLEKKHVFE